jgi:hypothetical protein
MSTTREWLERAELERLLWALQDDLGLNATEDIVADVRAARLALTDRRATYGSRWPCSPTTSA